MNHESEPPHTWEREVRAILHGLGVAYDPAPDPPTEHLLPSGMQPERYIIRQQSLRHPGVTYQIEVVDGCPQLRVCLPDDHVAGNYRVYRVRPAQATPLWHWATALLAYPGSSAWAHCHDALLGDLLFSVGEMCKRLFWSAYRPDDSARYPLEIRVWRVY